LGRSNITLSSEFYIVKISPQPLFTKEGRKLTALWCD